MHQSMTHISMHIAVVWMHKIDTLSSSSVHVLEVGQAVGVVQYAVLEVEHQLALLCLHLSAAQEELVD